jgi:hypothetical protein
LNNHREAIAPQNSSLREIEAKHFQLSMNAQCTPGRVLADHAKNEFAQFPADTFSPSSGSMPRNPRPIQLEPRSMPTNDSLWLDKDQRLLPSRPEPAQCHPEQSVRSCKSRLRMLPLQNAKLLPQRKVLQDQIAAREKKSSNEAEQEPQQANHMISFTHDHTKLSSQFIYLI